MSVTPGQHLAHYEILELIGKGGMGEVYRARDGKLGRDVAIKILPKSFPERKSGWPGSSTRLLAQLNHPNMPPQFQMSLLPKFLWLAFFPQLVLWVGFTVVAGSMTGSLAAAWMRRRKV